MEFSLVDTFHLTGLCVCSASQSSGVKNVANTYLSNLLVQGASHWRPSGVIVKRVLEMADGYRIKTIKLVSEVVWVNSREVVMELSSCQDTS